MRRVPPAVAAMLLLAACDAFIALPPGPPPAPGATPQLQVGFPPGGVADTIVVNAVDRLPLRGADLIAPDGGVTSASYVDVAASPRFAGGQRAIGNSWRSAVADDAMGAMSIGNAQTSAAFESREQLLANVSTADIPLPDPVLYRRDWQRYRIRLTFGTPPGEVERRDVEAPPPR